MSVPEFIGLLLVWATLTSAALICRQAWQQRHRAGRRRGWSDDSRDWWDDSHGH